MFDFDSIYNIVYLIGFVMTLRPAAGHFAWSAALHYKQEKPDNADWALALLSGAAVALVWPLALVFAASGKLLPSVGAEKRGKLHMANKKLEAEKQRLIEENKELDKQLKGILKP